MVMRRSSNEQVGVKAVRLPLTLAPSEDSSTGTAAPMAMPSVMGKATENVIVPVASACKMPTAAEAQVFCKCR